MAGIVFQTSFDHYTTITHRFNSNPLAGNGTATIGAWGRNGTNGLRLNGVWVAFGNPASAYAIKTLPAPLGTIWFAFAFKTDSLPPSGFRRVIAEIRDVGTVQVFLQLMPDGTIQICRGTFASPTLIATVVNFSMLTNVYYHFEWKTVIHPSAGALTFWVNEVEKYNQSGLVTRTTANSTVSEITLGHNSVINVGSPRRECNPYG